MKKTILLCSLIFGSMTMQAQYQSKYETVKSTTEGEVIYKGSCTFDDILQLPAFAHNPWESYEPNPEKIKTLKEKLRGYRLVILLGTWCEDSHRLMPQLYKVLSLSDYPLEELQIFALDRDKKGLNREEERYRVANVPSIIVFKGDQEKGRITENVEKSIESDLTAIIEK